MMDCRRPSRPSVPHAPGPRRQSRHGPTPSHERDRLLRRPMIHGGEFLAGSQQHRRRESRRGPRWPRTRKRGTDRPSVGGPIRARVGMGPAEDPVRPRSWHERRLSAAERRTSVVSGGRRVGSRWSREMLLTKDPRSPSFRRCFPLVFDLVSVPLLLLRALGACGRTDGCGCRSGGSQVES